MKVTNINMIGHGTNGSDGIEEGIHLRWSFNDKLGFPPCFELYRRESEVLSGGNSPGNLYPLNIIDTPLGDIPLPYSQSIVRNDTIHFKIDSLIHEGQEAGFVTIDLIELPDGTSRRCIHNVSGELTILFSKPVSRIGLEFFFESDSAITITGLQSNSALYQPYEIPAGTSGLQGMYFDIPGATGIKIGGTNIYMTRLEVWLPVKGREWEKFPNLCGCGLPVNQQGTPYTNDVYEFIGKDLATALCRLGYKNVAESPITAAEFIELKAMLLTMVGEGSVVPVGWNHFPNDEADTSTSLEFSKYDFLLTQSLQVFFAKILGLYHVDTDVDNNIFYDYKVTAKWPEQSLRRLDHQIIFTGYKMDERLFPIQKLDDYVVLLGTTSPQIVEAPYSLFRTSLGLEISIQNFPVVLSFSQPVTEVQLVLINPDFGSGNTSITVEAYKNLYTAYADKEVLVQERGLIRLRAEQIDSIKIYGPRVIVCRVHYDFEPYPVGTQNYIICGLKKQTHLPLATPSGLTATFIPGGTVTDQDGNTTEKTSLAGLRWNATEDPDWNLISISPVLYHIERKAEGSAAELITEESPMFVSPSVIERNSRNIPIGWPKERQYYTESVSKESANEYRIAAIDLFGRQSEFTGFVTYEITSPKPPHPVDVVAKFLDYGTYHSSTGAFDDVTLNGKDKDWLLEHRKNAIVVSWKWPENLQLQAPDTEGFNVYFKQGWLNNYTGMVETDVVETVLSKTSLNLSPEELEKYAALDIGPENIAVYRFKISLQVYPTLPEPVHPLRRGERAVLPENAFRLCWLNQGNHRFLILKNKGNTSSPTLWVLKLNDIPVTNKGFGVAVTSDKEFFINYKNHSQWTDTSVSHQEPKNLALKSETNSSSQPIYEEDYTIYIEDPKFPYPVITAADTNKVRYAQIGVNAFIDTVQGSVSFPSTIMAIYRGIPAAPPAFAPQPDEPIQALKAMRANVHGKSSFALRWNKTKLPVKHHVYRSLDETLFSADNKLRPTRAENIYTDFKTNHPDFDGADVDAVKAIVYEPNPKLVARRYSMLTPGQLQILASLPDNENAFTKINEATIDESDPLYEDRVTEIPDPINGAAYTPDPANVLLYVDSTLNGQSSNRYFYAVRSVDTNGLQSILSLATPPVEIPKTTPPPAPVITSVLGGENQIIIKWAKNPGININGYLLYRTQDIKDAGDWRKMELIKANESDLFTVAVNGSLPEKEFSFTDSSAVARLPYYYSAVAVGLNDEGKWLKSRMSKTKTGQAYDLTPPEPPVWEVAEWFEDESGSAIHLIWHTVEESTYCVLQRRPLGGGVWHAVSPELSSSSSLVNFDFIDRTVIPENAYDYRVLAIDAAGNKTQVFNIQSVWPSMA